MKRFRTWAAALGLCTLLATTGCYGPFNLTKKVHKWNGEIGEKWAQEGMFLVLVILPVYEFSAFLDALIFNSIEFWTGDNPISAP